MRILPAVVLAAALTLLYGCFEYEEEVVLNADGSGTVKLKYTMAEKDAVHTERNWKPGPDGVLNDMPVTREHAEQFFAGREGIAVSDILVETRDDKRTVSYSLAFDNCSNLQTEGLDPFRHGMEFVRNKDGSFSYKRICMDPALREEPEDFLEPSEESEESHDGAEESEDKFTKLPDEWTKGVPEDKLSFSVILPLEIAETNAHHHDGKTATWKMETREEIKKWERQGWVLTAKTVPPESVLLPVIVGVAIVIAFTAIVAISVGKRGRKPRDA